MINRVNTTLAIAVIVVGSVATGFAYSPNGSGWLNWRGPEGTGVASSAGPTHWSDSENIKWKVEIPGRGFSTPIIVGDRLFLTTAVATGKVVEQPIAKPAADQAKPQSPPSRGQVRGRGRGGQRPQMPRDEQSFDVMCFDRNTGELVWKQTANIATPHEGFHRSYGSYASNSPISDGENIYISFGSYGIYCYDLDGGLKWKMDPGIHMEVRNQFGEGSAPAIWGDALVHIFDQEGQSQIIVLNKNTGEELWRRNRDEPTTWAMPLITEVGGQSQIITSGTNKVRSYDLETGELIWKCAGLGLNAIPAPVRYKNTVLAMTGYRNPNLMAIELGRTGDLTGTDAVKWNVTRGTSYTCSPVLAGDEYYTLTDRGALSCFNAGTGEPYYSQEQLPRGSQFKASPVAAGGKLYMADEDGRVHIVKMGPVFELIATNELTDQFFVASPVIVDGNLYLRSRESLYCISEQ